MLADTHAIICHTLKMRRGLSACHRSAMRARGRPGDIYWCAGRAWLGSRPARARACGPRRRRLLHLIAGRSLLAHVLRAVRAAGATATAVVVGPDHDIITSEAKRLASDAEIVVQSERRGTAHAVLAAKAAITRGADDVLVVFADTPLIHAQSLARLREALANGAAGGAGF